MNRFQRYEVASEWSIDRDLSNDTCMVESADLRDKQGGHVYREGAFRVRLRSGVKVEGFRSRTFYGEVAWQDAQRLAVDTHFKYQREVDATSWRIGAAL